MKIGAVVLVKDEIELLRRNLAHHSSIGVDCFVICDRGSNDGSQRELAELAKRHDVHLFRQHVYALRKVDAETMRVVRLAALQEMRRVFSPDWLFPMDTDEFWVPGSGDLATVFGESGAEYLKVNRFNAALPRDTAPTALDHPRLGTGLLEQEIIVKREQLSRERADAEPGVPWVLHAVLPKFATSRSDFAEVAPGFHDVRCSRPVASSWAADLLIVHFPFTTFERFAHKVASVHKHLKHIGPTFKGEQAWHWRRWATLDEQGSLRGEFDRQLFGPSELRALRDRRAVMTVGDYFAAHARSEAEPREAFGRESP